MNDTPFPPTHWSAVLEAAGAEPDKARRAFEQLCADYRDAIAHWMGFQRLGPEDAEDAAHDFIEQWLLRENPLEGFQRGERRFREFLSVCLRRFLADWHARRRAARRGGGSEPVPWEHDDLIADGVDPYPYLDFAFAAQIHAGALAKLRVDWQNKLSGHSFDRLYAIALGDADNPGYTPLAKELQASVGTVKSWVFRFRREYHEAFRDAVSRQTDPAHIDEELVHLHKLLLNPPRVEAARNVDRLQPPLPDSR